MGSINKEIDDFIKAEEKAQKAAQLRGKHYTEYVEKVRRLKKMKQNEEAITLLYELIEVVEKESEVYKSYGIEWAVAPWYYEQLAIVFRKEKRFEEEVAILERHKEKNNGKSWTNIEERLKNAGILCEKQKKPRKNKRIEKEP